VNRYLGLTGSERVDKRHPGVKALYEWVVRQYKNGRTTSLSDGELAGAAQLHLPERFPAGGKSPEPV
jgi:hypothetical protein